MKTKKVLCDISLSCVVHSIDSGDKSRLASSPQFSSSICFSTEPFVVSDFFMGRRPNTFPVIQPTMSKQTLTGM